MKRVIFVFFYLILLSIPIKACFLQLAPSAKLAACANISVMDNSSQAKFFNPAAPQKVISINTTYSNPFSINKLAFKCASGNYKIRNLNFHFGWQELGNNIYTEQTLLLGTSYRFYENIQVGANFRYLSKIVTTYKNETVYQLDLGGVIEFTNFSFFTSFLNCTYMDLDGETLPMENRTGILYQITDELILAGNIIKEIDYNFSFHFASKYQILDPLQLLVGFQTEPERLSGGLSLDLYNFEFTYAVKNHLYLDLTHYFSLCYAF